MPASVTLPHLRRKPPPPAAPAPAPLKAAPEPKDDHQLVVVAGLERMLEDAAKAQQGMLERIINAIVGRKPPTWKFTITYNEQGRPAEVLASPVKE